MDSEVVSCTKSSAAIISWQGFAGGQGWNLCTRGLASLLFARPWTYKQAMVVGSLAQNETCGGRVRGMATQPRNGHSGGA